MGNGSRLAAFNLGRNGLGAGSDGCLVGHAVDGGLVSNACKTRCGLACGLSSDDDLTNRGEVLDGCALKFKEHGSRYGYGLAVTVEGTLKHTCIGSGKGNVCCEDVVAIRCHRRKLFSSVNSNGICRGSGLRSSRVATGRKYTNSAKSCDQKYNESNRKNSAHTVYLP